MGTVCVRDLMFSRWCCWCLSSALWRHEALWMGTNVFEEHTASMFRAEAEDIILQNQLQVHTHHLNPHDGHSFNVSNALGNSARLLQLSNPDFLKFSAKAMLRW